MTMRAVLCERYGAPNVLCVREVAEPEPREHEVRIAVHATSVTAACGMMRRGDTLMARLVLGFFRPRKRFRILGIEIAGTVERVGKRVRRFRPGDRVFGFTGFSAGGYAELVCLPETASIELAPVGVSDQEACSLVDGPTTSLFFLRDLAKLQPGERVAIVGASGSIGTAAVQLARHFGAEVTAICSGRNADLARSLGAHHVIDYTREDYATRGESYDIVFDTVGKSRFSIAKRCLARGGRYLLTVGGPHEYLRAAWTRVFSDRRQIVGMSVEKRAALREVSELVAQGALRPVIDRCYPLEALPEAHGYVDTGRKRGNVVIDVRAR